jgi:heme/copper-type cytochrome/quinol oxidase subunit 2
MYGSYLLLGSYIILAIWIIGFVTILRKRLSCMAGMMTAMVLGMSMGLGMGTLISVLLPGQFFQASMISMLIGGLIGTLAGLPISIMAVLDGMLAGIMGGMMGAMLTVMISAAYLNPTLKTMAVLCYGINFILLIMLQGEVKADHLSQRSFIFSKPLPMFVTICICIALIFQSKIIEDSPNNNPTDHTTAASSPTLKIPTISEHNHADINNTVTPTNKNDEELLIVAADYSFSLQTINLNSKQTVKITLENKGNVEHDFEISGTDVHVHAAPGKSSSTLATFKKPGQYKAVCTLPGHKEAGMISIVNIS